jgi:hypothetical protein
MSNDVQGLPNVEGLAQLIAQDEPEKVATPVQTQETIPVTEQQTPQAEEFDLAQFKTPEELLKGYKNVQGAFTRTSQENKALKEQIDQIQAQQREYMELMRLSQMAPQQPQQAPQKDFEQLFIEDPKKAVAVLAHEQAQSMLLQSKVQDVLEEESLKAPEEFGERYNYAKYVSKQFPQLVTSSAGVRKLFQIGDKLRAEAQQKQARQLVSKVFGDDADFEKFKQLIKKDTSPGQIQTNNAYMPDTISGRNNSEPAPFNVDMEIDAAVKKGDPDAVIAALFKQRGLK